MGLTTHSLSSAVVLRFYCFVKSGCGVSFCSILFGALVWRLALVWHLHCLIKHWDHLTWVTGGGGGGGAGLKAFSLT